MGETLNLLFRSQDDGTYSIEVKESWSGRIVSGSFVPPFTTRQLNAVQKKLNRLELTNQELRDIGERLFLSLCGSAAEVRTGPRETSDHSVRAVLRSVIQRTLRRRGTVALTFGFSANCADLARYPWELLHNGEHFLLASGVFTLTRILLQPDEPVGCELPVHPPMSMLYIGSSPSDCEPLETERSYEALHRGLARLIESGQLILNRLEPCTFDELVRYLNSYGGAGILDDSETPIPCYIVHFDGHGAHGRLCPNEDCGRLNDPDERRCIACDSSLSRVKAQNYLCFCNDDGSNRYIDTQSLRDLFITSDVRLAVFSACETAMLTRENSRHRHVAFDTSLATALVTAQVPAVVAMPFSLHDDLSPTFMFHFYEALADGRTLEEALSRARQAMLPMNQKGWFIPVLYRHVSEGQEAPVALLADQDEDDENEHPLAHLGASINFVGREREVRELCELIAAAIEESPRLDVQSAVRPRPAMRHIALTGPAGIGKSALAFEAVRRSQPRFPGVGGVIGLTLQGGKLFAEALIEIAHYLPTISTRMLHIPDVHQRERLILTAFRARVSRELPCLLLLDSFEEVKEQHEIKAWLRFLCDLPEQVVILLTSRSNPATMGVLEGASCRWYEYSVGKMNNADLLKLFTELASGSGLDQRIHLEDPVQQQILREICTLLDGYPLGAELIFGTAHSIGGKVYTPEAATRSLEEVRDELRETPLAGIWAVLEVAYLRLSPSARLLLSYLAAFKLPFSSKQIVLLVSPETLQAAEAIYLERVHHQVAVTTEQVRPAGVALSTDLARDWRAARDELVQASFLGFDGRVYSIHAQVRNFALSYLPASERRRVHLVTASYYLGLTHPSPEEWFAAIEHLEGAGDLEEAVRAAVRASWDLCGRGHTPELLVMLRRVESHALRLGDKTAEGKIQCCLGAILRQIGRYAEAVGCLTRSLSLHREQHEDNEAAWALYELAMLCREEGNLQQATKYADEALELFRAVGDKKGEAWMHLVKAQICRSYGDYRASLSHFDYALPIFHQLANDEGSAWTLLDRGTAHHALGHESKARTDYDEAQRLFKALGLRSAQAWVFAHQAVSYTEQGELELADRLCNEALTIFHEQNLRRGEGWTLRALGDILRARGQSGDAQGCYEKASAIFSELGDRVDEARVVNALGFLVLDEGELLTAKEYFEQTLTIAHEQGARQIEARTLRGLGDVARTLRRFDEANHYYLDAAAIAVELAIPAERQAIARRHGELYLEQGQYEAALRAWLEALSLDRRLGHPARARLQEQIAVLTQEHHLETAHIALSKQYNLC